MANLFESLLIGGAEIGAGMLLGPAGPLALGAAGSAGAAAASALLKMGIGMDVASLASALSRPSLQHQNRERLISSPIASLPVVYGKARLGCHLVHATATSDNNTLWYVGGVCHGEIGAFDEIYVDGNLAVDVGGNVRPSDPGPVAISSYTADTFLLHVNTGSTPHGLVPGDDIDAWYFNLPAVRKFSWVVFTVQGPYDFTLPLYANPWISAPGYTLAEFRRNTPGYLGLLGFCKYLGALDQTQYTGGWQPDGVDNQGVAFHVAGGASGHNLTDWVPQWLSTAIGKYVAYVVVQMNYSSSRFPGAFPEVTVNVRGKKVYDPRTAVAITSSSVANPTVLTAGTAHGRLTGDLIRIIGHSNSTPSLAGGVYRVTKINSTQLSIPVNVTVGGSGGTLGVVGYSANPALCQRDYLTDRIYGRNVPDAMIDDSTNPGGFAGEATMCGDGPDNLTGAATSQPQWVPADTGELAVADVYLSTDGTHPNQVHIPNHGYTAGQDVYFLAITTTPAILGRQRVLALTGTDYFTLDAGVQAGGAPTGVAVAFTVGWSHPTPNLATCEAARQQETFRCDGMVDTSRSLRNNMEALLTASRAELCYWGGGFHVFTRRAVSPTIFALTADTMLRGQIRTTMPGAAKSPNVVRVTFIDAANNLQPNVFLYPPLDASNPYLTADNGIKVEKALELSFTNDLHMAQQLAMVVLKEMRAGILMACAAKESALILTCADVVPVTYDSPGWTAQPMWVCKVRILPQAAVGLELQLYQAAAYTYDLVPGRMPQAGTALPSPWQLPDPPTGLILTTGTSDPRILVQWTASNDARIDHYLLQAERVSSLDPNVTPDGDWRTYAPATADSQYGWIGDAANGDVWNVRVCGVTVIGVESAWLETDSYTVTVQSAATLGTITRATSTSAVTYTITLGPACVRVKVYSVQNTGAGGANPLERLVNLVDDFLGTPGSVQTVVLATTSSDYRRTLIVPYDVDGYRGTDSGYLEDQATSSGSGPSAAPSFTSGNVTPAQTSFAVTWSNNGDSTSVTRWYINGVVRYTSAAGATSATIPATGKLLPATSYQLTCDHYLNGLASTQATVVIISTSALSGAPTSFSVTNCYTAAYQYYTVSWSGGAGGAWEIYESPSSTPGSGYQFASGASGTTATWGKLLDTSGNFYYFLRYTSPQSGWIALATNPLRYSGCP